MNSISIVIVHYNKLNEMLFLIDLIKKYIVNIEYEIIIVNNGEDIVEVDNDNTVIVENKSNLGYSKACNIGAKIAKYENIIFTNADIIIMPSFEDEISAIIENMKDKCIYGFEQKEFNGDVADVIRFYPIRFLDLILHKMFNKINSISNCKVPWVQSSFILIKKKWFEYIGGFNEEYFVFMADVEICLWSWTSGGSVFCSDKLSLRADGKRASSGKIVKWFIPKTVQNIHLNDSLMYFRNLKKSKSLKQTALKVNKIYQSTLADVDS